VHPAYLQHRAGIPVHDAFRTAIPNSGPYHEFKEFNNDLPFTCATSTLRSDANGVVKVPTGPGVGVEIDPAYVAKHVVVKA